MATDYMEIPFNFDEICPYVIRGREAVCEIFRCSVRFYFYDTSSFRKHVHMQHPKWWFDYLKRTDGVVVISRCILMELGSLSGILEADYIEFIRHMSEGGIQILILDEEDIYLMLSEVFSVHARIHKCLELAVKAAKTMTGTIQDTLQADEALRYELFEPGGNVSQDFYERFFQSVRNNKEQADNLGEEILAVCVHLLSNIPGRGEYPYIVLTEDKGAVGVINKVRRNSEQYIQGKQIAVYSTPKIAQRMFLEGIISGRDQVEAVLLSGQPNPEIKIRASEEYDIEDEFKAMSCHELAEKIVTPGAIYIKY